MPRRGVEDDDLAALRIAEVVDEAIREDRSSKRASQPTFGRAQWSVGSIDDDGILYGFTTYAFTRSTIATAAMIVTAQSTTTRMGSGSPRVSRSTGLREWCLGAAAGSAAPRSRAPARPGTGCPRGSSATPTARRRRSPGVARPGQWHGWRGRDVGVGRRVALVDVAQRTLLTRLCSRRHRSISPWSPERSTVGTLQPRYSAGRV